LDVTTSRDESTCTRLNSVVSTRKPFTEEYKDFFKCRFTEQKYAKKFFFSNTESNRIKYICVFYFHFFVFLYVLFCTFDVILQWRQNMCHVIFHVCHWSVTTLHKLSDQYHWALWNTHHIKLTFVTPTNKLSSFLLIFELFSLKLYWKYSIFLHETMTWHIFWRHWRMTSKVRKRTSRNTKIKDTNIFNMVGVKLKYQ
jgi:hypothetical protein